MSNIANLGPNLDLMRLLCEAPTLWIKGCQTGKYETAVRFDQAGRIVVQPLDPNQRRMDYFGSSYVFCGRSELEAMLRWAAELAREVRHADLIDEQRCHLHRSFLAGAREARSAL